MKLNILGKVCVPIMAILLLVTGSGFYTAYKASQNSIDELLQAELAVVSKLMARNALTFSNTVQRDLQALSQLNRILDFLKAEDPKTKFDGMTSALVHFSNTYSHFETVMLVNRDGIVVGSSGKTTLGMSLADREYFRRALTGKKAFSEPLTSRDTANAVFSMGFPVMFEGKVLAVLAVTIPLHEFSATMVDDIRIAQTGYPIVLSPKGVVIAHQDRSQIGTVQAQSFDWGKQAMALDNANFHYTYNGVFKMGHVTLEPSTGWRIVLTVDESDITAKTAAAVKASVISLGLVVLSLAVAMFFLIRNIVSKPLGIMAGLADAVAHGNLDVDTQSHAKVFANKGEITTTFASLCHMLTALKENIALAEQKSADAAEQTRMAEQATQQAQQARTQAERAKSEGMHAAAGQLEEIISTISSASEELSAQVEHSQKGAAEQSTRVGEAATAMEEMHSTVIEVARNASAASQMATNTRSRAEEGAKIVSSVVLGIKNIQTQSVALKADMSELVEHAQSINQIMRVISDIADQTNLLALNAAIEAARAGDAGRGFAVVADEVRKLAEKTMASTTDVGNAINSIQQSATKNMAQVDATVQTIEAATSLADTSGQVLSDIVGMADASADQVNSIATASEQQSATSEEINRSIGQVNLIASETTTAMREAASAVAALAGQAQLLQSMVEKMQQE